MANELRTWQYGVIILGMLAIAYWPVFTSHYLRQDDWMIFFWDREAISHHPYLVNYGILHGRPIYFIIAVFSHSFIYVMSDAVFVRAFVLVAIAMSAILLLRWFRKFEHAKLFSFVTCVAIYTLPPFHAVIGTIEYLSAVLAALETQVALFLAFWACERLNSQRYLARVGLAIAFVFLLCAELTYPPASMFSWFLLAVALLGNRPESDFASYQRLGIMAAMCALSMVAYYLTYRLVYYAYGIEKVFEGREIVLSFNVREKLNFLINHILPMAGSFWDITGSVGPEGGWFPYARTLFPRIAMFVSISLLLFPALVIWRLQLARERGRGGLEHVLPSAAIVAVIVPLSVAVPLLAPGNWAPYRSLMGLMPLLLFLMFWSIRHVIARLGPVVFPRSREHIQPILSTVAATVILIGSTATSNYLLTHYLVRPLEYELGFLRENLHGRVVPRIEKGERVNVFVVLPEDPALVQRRRGFGYDEYMTAPTWYAEWAPAVVAALLREKGIESALWKRRVNGITWTLPWGRLALGKRSMVPEDVGSWVMIDVDSLPKLPLPGFPLRLPALF